MARTWIAEVVCHEEAEHKIWTKDHLTLDDIASAVSFGAGEEERC